VVGRDPERDSRSPDLLLRPHEPLRHRRLRHEERAGDLVRREAAEGSQGQRDLRLGRQCRVTAREDQAQPLVRDRLVLLHRLLHVKRGEQLRLAAQVLLAANAIDRAVAGGRQQPRAGVLGRAVAGPALERSGEGLLHRVLG